MTASVSAAEAFERYVVPELPVLLRAARALTRHDAEAEDLVQDTLLRAYRSIDRFDGRHPRAWLLTILRNTHINRNRRRRPELLRDPDGPAGTSGPAVEDDLGGIDREVDREIGSGFDAAVDVALAALPPQQRRVVELVDVAGLSYAEAARQLEVPVGTVMSRLHRARRRLRELLAAAGVELGSLS